MVERLTFKQRFVVFIVGIMLISSAIFYAYSTFSVRDKIYYVNFSTSVNGLKEGSQVTYKGVDIGEVSKIKIDLPKVDLVKVTIRIRYNFPVYSGYKASLNARGISGNYTMDLNKVSESFDELPSGSYIEPQSTTLENLFQNVPELIQEGKFILKKFNEATEGQVMKTLITDISVLARNLRKLVKEIRGGTREVSLTSLELNRVLKNFDLTLSKMNLEMVDNLIGAADTINAFVKMFYNKSKERVDFWTFLSQL